MHVTAAVTAADLVGLQHCSHLMTAACHSHARIHRDSEAATLGYITRRLPSSPERRLHPGPADPLELAPSRRCRRVDAPPGRRCPAMRQCSGDPPPPAPRAARLACGLHDLQPVKFPRRAVDKPGIYRIAVSQKVQTVRCAGGQLLPAPHTSSQPLPPVWGGAAHTGRTLLTYTCV